MKIMSCIHMVDIGVKIPVSDRHPLGTAAAAGSEEQIGMIRRRTDLKRPPLLIPAVFGVLMRALCTPAWRKEGWGRHSPITLSRIAASRPAAEGAMALGLPAFLKERIVPENQTV